MPGQLCDGFAFGVVSVLKRWPGKCAILSESNDVLLNVSFQQSPRRLIKSAMPYPLSLGINSAFVAKFKSDLF